VAQVAVSAPRRQFVAQAPSSRDTRPHHTPSPAAPQNPQRTPAAQPEPQQPSKNGSGLLAGGDPPVARQLPPADPTPPQAPVTPPAPVEQPAPAPVERVTPSEPYYGDQGHDQGHGQGHAYGHGGGDGGGQHGDGHSQE
jgi:hypothetical protein